MIKFITISPSSPFNFILNGKVGGGEKFRFKLIFEPELKKLMLLVLPFYRNPSLLNTFEFGG